jgi:hypothetical protein
VATKDKLLRHAKLLLKLARSTANPDLSSAFIQRAADLKETVDQLTAPDVSPLLPDRE